MVLNSDGDADDVNASWIIVLVFIIFATSQIFASSGSLYVRLVWYNRYVHPTGCVYGA